jgi:hypothetical protein
MKRFIIPAVAALVMLAAVSCSKGDYSFADTSWICDYSQPLSDGIMYMQSILEFGPYAVTERNYARQDESDPWVEFSILIGSYVYDAETRTVDITLDEQVSGKVKVLLPVMTSAKLNPRKETLTVEHEIDNYVYYRYLRD